MNMQYCSLQANAYVTFLSSALTTLTLPFEYFRSILRRKFPERNLESEVTVYQKLITDLVLKK